MRDKTENIVIVILCLLFLFVKLLFDGAILEKKGSSDKVKAQESKILCLENEIKKFSKR